MSAPTIEFPAVMAEDEPEEAPVDKPSDEAPWGYRADGVTPRAKPGAKPSGTPRKAPSPRSRPAPGSTSKAKSGQPDFRPALIGLAAIPTMLLGLFARSRKDEKQQRKLQLDALAIKVHAPGIANAVNETAKTNSKVADALEKVIAVGPAGLIFAAVAPLVLQCLANHEAFPVNPEMGIMDADQLVAAATA